MILQKQQLTYVANLCTLRKEDWHCLRYMFLKKHQIGVNRFKCRQGIHDLEASTCLSVKLSGLLWEHYHS